MKKFSYKLNMKMIIIITSVLVNLSKMKLMQEFLTVQVELLTEVMMVRLIKTLMMEKIVVYTLNLKEMVIKLMNKRLKVKVMIIMIVVLINISKVEAVRILTEVQVEFLSEALDLRMVKALDMKYRVMLVIKLMKEFNQKFRIKLYQ